MQINLKYMTKIGVAKTIDLWPRSRHHKINGYQIRTEKSRFWKTSFGILRHQQRRINILRSQAHKMIPNFGEDIILVINR